MVKELICLDTSHSNFAGYRGNLIKYFEDQGYHTIHVRQLDFVGDKPIFNGEHINCLNSLVFPSDIYGIGIPEYLSSCNYIVDTGKVAKGICDSKVLLMKLLKDMNFPVPSLYSEIQTDYVNNIFYTYNGPMIAPTMVGVKDNKPHAFAPWDEEVIKGYYMYYYLYEPIIETKIIYINNLKFVAKQIKPEQENKYVSLDYLVEEKELILNHIDNLPPLSTLFKDQISKALKRLGAVGAEVLVGLDIKGKPIIIDIDSSYFPTIRRIIGYPSFEFAIRNKFRKFMQMGVDIIE